MNERTIHRKLQVILDHARRGRYESIVALRTALEAEPPISFMYRKARDRKVYCSARSISHSIHVATQLQLLDAESGRLTDLGAKASNPQKFDTIVGKQALAFLGEAGVPFTKITDAINRRLLRSSPPITPTLINIWSALDEPMAFSSFALYLRLIGFCGVLATSQSKIFLPR